MCTRMCYIDFYIYGFHFEGSCLLHLFFSIKIALAREPHVVCLLCLPPMSYIVLDTQHVINKG